MIRWNLIEKPRLRKPLVVEGLPGIGNVGKVAVEYLIEKLKAKKFAELYSDHYPYHVFVNEDDTLDMPKNEFYYYRNKSQDIILITGDIQSMTPHGHYEIAEEVTKFIKKLGARTIFTTGGFGVNPLPKKPKVIGAVTHENMKKRYSKYGIKFESGERVGIIIGASGLFLGIGKLNGLEGMCLMGETLNRQMFTDTNSAKQVLLVLLKILGVSIDMKSLEERSKEMERAIQKAQEIENKLVEKAKKGEDLRYIG